MAVPPHTDNAASADAKDAEDKVWFQHYTALKLFKTATTQAQIEQLAEIVDLDEFKESFPVFNGTAPEGHPLPQMWKGNTSSTSNGGDTSSTSNGGVVVNNSTSSSSPGTVLQTFVGVVTCPPQVIVVGIPKREGSNSRNTICFVNLSKHPQEDKPRGFLGDLTIKIKEDELPSSAHGYYYTGKSRSDYMSVFRTKAPVWDVSVKSQTKLPLLSQITICNVHKEENTNYFFWDFQFVVKGRVPGGFDLQCHYDPDSCLLRIDSDEMKEFWIEVTGIGSKGSFRHKGRLPGGGKLRGSLATTQCGNIYVYRMKSDNSSAFWLDVLMTTSLRSFSFANLATTHLKFKCAALK